VASFVPGRRARETLQNRGRVAVRLAGRSEGAHQAIRILGRGSGEGAPMQEDMPEVRDCTWSDG